MSHLFMHDPLSTPITFLNKQKAKTTKKKQKKQEMWREQGEESNFLSPSLSLAVY